MALLEAVQDSARPTQMPAPRVKVCAKTDIADHGQLKQQAETLTHTPGEAEQRGRADQDRPVLKLAELGLGHGHPPVEQ